ncbi:MAG: hypothetical protein A2104_04330 [Candidatus Melainabacteria bacterium GWF2_32_7]|nr:MAG: hypothetical protein A2104_04330 [Candidatus Melainabacteria bacterium GWF2_32_7]
MATIFLAITLVAIIIGKAALAIFLGLLIFLGTKEYVNLIRAKGLNPSINIILLVDFLLLLSATLQEYDFLPLIVTFGVIIAFITIMTRGHKATTNDLATTVLGFLYGGWLPMHIMLLRNLNKSSIEIFGISAREGLGYIILIFFVISASDIAAYYIGKRFGKRPLWPEISPKKTIEGSIGGTTGGVIASLIIGHLIGLGLFHSIIAGLLLSITAQIGDLSESMLKRDAGFKDSGNLLPGHGGVLDRADSYIFTGAVAYYYFSLFVIGNITL